MSLEIQAGRYILNPYLNLEHDITSASKSLSAVFGSIDSALDKGKLVRDAVSRDAIGPIFRRHLAQARIQGFSHGAEISKASMPALYGRVVSDAARRRSAKVNDWMTQTTRRTLKRVPDSEYILSEDRAIAAVRYEMGRAYFRGLRDSFGNDSKHLKGWKTMEGESCPTCLLNEDQGRLPILDVFDSGDWFPPNHLGCGCVITISR